MFIIKIGELSLMSVVYIHETKLRRFNAKKLSMRAHDELVKFIGLHKVAIKSMAFIPL